MHVLLTNDDGYASPGLAAIRAELTRLCTRVTTIAPIENSSGFARKSTFTRAVRIRRLEGGPHPTYTCDGTPADCVRAGLLAGLATGADLVVSGINHGANVADDVHYSGTVAAGLEAASLGTPALCLSQQTPTGSFSVNFDEDVESLGLAYDFGESAPHGAAIADAMATVGAGAPTVLSVNYPAAPRRDRAVLTRIGRRHYPRSPAMPWAADEDSRSTYLFGAPEELVPDDGDGGGTDIAALRSGHISISLLAVSAAVAGDASADHGFVRRLAERLLDAHGLPLQVACD